MTCPNRLTLKSEIWVTFQDGAIFRGSAETAWFARDSKSSALLH